MAKPTPTRTCQTCGTTIVGRRSDTLYCSEKCRSRWRLTHPPNVACSVDMCDQPVHALGFCKKHHTRWLRTGTTKLVRQPGVMARFQRNIKLEGDCWIWQGQLNNKGYGCISENGKRQYVHRWSYEHYVGPVPAGMMVDNMCHTPACVNHDHLRLATPSENTRNQRPELVRAVSGFKHVRQTSNASTYFVSLHADGKTYVERGFRTIEDAHTAAKRLSAKYQKNPADPRLKKEA